MQLKSFKPIDFNLSLNFECSLNNSLLISNFTIRGDLEKVSLLTAPLQINRQMDLWNHTCFEWFIKPKGQNNYWEFNLSPQGSWNVFSFKDYRSKIEIENRAHLLFFDRKITGTKQIDFSSVIEFNSIFNDKKISEFSMNICSVIEDKKQQKSYWSLIHLQNKPDFHHPSHFIHNIKLSE